MTHCHHITVLAIEWKHDREHKSNFKVSRTSVIRTLNGNKKQLELSGLIEFSIFSVKYSVNLLIYLFHQKRWHAYRLYKRDLFVAPIKIILCFYRLYNKKS